MELFPAPLVVAPRGLLVMCARRELWPNSRATLKAIQQRNHYLVTNPDAVPQTGALTGLRYAPRAKTTVKQGISGNASVLLSLPKSERMRSKYRFGNTESRNSPEECSWSVQGHGCMSESLGSGGGSCRWGSIWSRLTRFNYFSKPL
jgi:hypothetical protein